MKTRGRTLETNCAQPETVLDFCGPYSDACWFVCPRSVPGVMAALDAAIHENTVVSI